MGFACVNLDRLFAVVLMPFENSCFPISLLSKERRKKWYCWEGKDVGKNLEKLVEGNH